jgi:hypothetical protein
LTISPGSEAETDTPSPPDRFRATIYDYTNNRTIVAQGCVDEPQVLEVSESNLQPLPSREEFEAALKVLRRDPEFSAALQDKRLRPTSYKLDRAKMYKVGE